MDMVIDFMEMVELQIRGMDTVDQSLYALASLAPHLWLVVIGLSLTSRSKLVSWSYSWLFPISWWVGFGLLLVWMEAKPVLLLWLSFAASGWFLVLYYFWLASISLFQLGYWLWRLLWSLLPKPETTEEVIILHNPS